MIAYDDAFNALRLDIVKLAQLERDRIDLLNSPLNAAMKDERDQDLKRDIERQQKRVNKVLENVAEFPPYHIRHKDLLEKFHSKASYDKSVFVMTKFPDPKMGAPKDAQLDKIIELVREAVKKEGYEARLAKDVEYHSLLWDNVELYLLGCKRGIAIVEDKYLPELNPNVAMEWGWMRGLGRKVLYLVEKDFKGKRADWSGLTESPFDWANPSNDIETAVHDWLTKTV